MFNIHNVMTQLAAKRPCFHSEADFQHSLASEFHHLNGYDVRLEVPQPVDGDKAHIDIRLKGPRATCFLELKYKTSKLDGDDGHGVEVKGEIFKLKDHGAHDLARQDFIKDIWRLEQLVNGSPCSHGFTVLLTNDGRYWDPQRMHKGTNGEKFRVHQGQSLTGDFHFTNTDRDGIPENRRCSIILSGQYACLWKPYSNGECGFKYLTIPVV